MKTSRLFAILIIAAASLNLVAASTQSKTSPTVQAQPGSPPNMQQPDKSASFVAMENKNSMKITLKASRDQATAGSNFGITAEIENTSTNPIYIIPSAIAMTVPPELDANAPHDLWAFIPGVQVPKGEDYWSTVIVLEPGATTSAFWSGGNVSGSPDKNATVTWRARAWQTFLSGLAFSPGRYTLSVVGSYWDTYQGAKNRSVERHTETAAIQETITAPQSVILFGAAIGGLIAFILLTKLQPTNTTGWASVGWVTGSFSAILLSTIVTILIARLSQNQFIISVTVNDLWGAIAVGFIITAAGPSILRKVTGMVSSGANANTAGAAVNVTAAGLGQPAVPAVTTPSKPTIPTAPATTSGAMPDNTEADSIGSIGSTLVGSGEQGSTSSRAPGSDEKNVDAQDAEISDKKLTNVGPQSNNGQGS